MSLESLKKSLQELLDLVKSNKKLITEHERLVDVLRSGSKKDRKKEAKTQEAELKELKEKFSDKKEPTLDEKIKQVKEKYAEPKVKTFDDEVDTVKRRYGLKKWDTQQWTLDKSNYGPKKIGDEKINLYNPTDNIQRKQTRTGEEVPGVGRNKAVRQYTSAIQGTAQQQASTQATEDKKKNKKQPVTSLKDMSPEKQAEMQRLYGNQKVEKTAAEIIAELQKTRRQPTDAEINVILQAQASQEQEQLDAQAAAAEQARYDKMLETD